MKLCYTRHMLYHEREKDEGDRGGLNSQGVTHGSLTSMLGLCVNGT